jgi:hypothetical protein
LALTSELARRGIESVSLIPGELPPLDIRVIIATQPEETAAADRRLVLFHQGSNPRDAVEKALLLLLGKTGFKELVIGIDPGKQTGLAVLGDGLLIDADTYTRLPALLEEVKHVIQAFPSDKVILKIGNGAEEHGNALLDALLTSLPSFVEIQIVVEGRTNDYGLPSVEGLSKNTAAAFRIALRIGKTKGKL